MAQQLTNKKKTTIKRKHRPSRVGKLWYLLPFILLLFIFMLLRKACNDKKDSNTFEFFNAFHIKMPKGYEIHGIDISYFQGNFNWNTLKKAEDEDTKIGFVFIKATEGITRHDKMFKTNWQNAKKAGIPRGAYHYFISSRDGEEQAQNFIKNVSLEEGDLPPVLDIEHIRHASKEQMQKEVKDWIRTVEAHYGVKPIIYTFISFYRDYLGSDFDEYPLWIAHYQKQTVPRINRSWVFWQHDEEGKINGLKGHFDFNVFNGDSTDFKNLLIH